MKTLRYLSLACLVLFIFSCTPHTFIVNKNDWAFYLGRDSEMFRKIVCESGDLNAILAEVEMPDYIKKDLYTYNCTDQHSEQRVISTYLLLTPEEQNTLKSAFTRHDYIVNYISC